MFQLAMSSVVAVPFAGTTCENETELRQKITKTRLSVVASVENILLMQSPFVDKVVMRQTRMGPNLCEERVTGSLTWQILTESYNKAK
jgi:hypothetical protein